jgi:hypothetical protein
MRSASMRGAVARIAELEAMCVDFRRTFMWALERIVPFEAKVARLTENLGLHAWS